MLNALAQQFNRGHEIIMADDGSIKEEVEALKRELPHFKCPVPHVSHADTGFSASRARNLAASEADADYFVFLGRDCIPSPHFVSSNLTLMAQRIFRQWEPRFAQQEVE